MTLGEFFEFFGEQDYPDELKYKLNGATIVVEDLMGHLSELTDIRIVGLKTDDPGIILRCHIDR